MSAAPTWIVFGDDWGRHPSTTQHLFSHFPPTDRVIWVGSIGMRAPRLARSDLARIGERVRAWLSPASTAVPKEGRSPDVIVPPLLLPFHQQAAATRVNKLLLRAQFGRLLREARGPIILVAANPAAILYADVFRPDRIVYLRLDDFAALPGVDPSLVALVEPQMIARADLVAAPNSGLLLDGTVRAKNLLLPQGVDLERFAAVPDEPPATLTLGYWGALAAWLDFELVEGVARANPHWTLELRGPVLRTASDPQVAIDRLARLPNVRILPAVPHNQLAPSAAHWRAAWAPFLEGNHLLGASPLKLREYLAAGLPAATTVFFAELAQDLVRVAPKVSEVSAWLETVIATDDAVARRSRRETQGGQGWTGRAATFRSAALGECDD